MILDHMSMTLDTNLYEFKSRCFLNAQAGHYFINNFEGGKPR